MDITETTIEIQNQLGIHARAAAKFVQIATKYSSDIIVTKDSLDVNGKSIMSLIMLAVIFKEFITIKAVGCDAAECIKELTVLVNNKFGEDQ